MMKKYCDFGTTVALSLSDYKAHYLSQLPRRSRKESCYGLCARVIIESVVCEAIEAFGRDTVVNFVFENSHQFESARLAFWDLKDHVPLIADNLGRIAPGDKIQFPGLQAADLVASLARRSEPNATFSEVPFGTSRVPRTHGRLPMFHVSMDDARLLATCVQAAEIAKEKRWQKIKLKREIP